MIYKTVLDWVVVERYLRSIAARADLRVQWTDVMMPSTDGKVIYLPRCRSKDDPEEIERAVGLGIHEVGHLLYSDFDIFHAKNIRMGSPIQLCMNGVEDHRIEWLTALEYEGDRLHLNGLVEINVPTLKNPYREAQSTGHIIPDMIASLLAWEYTTRHQKFPSGELFKTLLFSERSKEFFAKFDKFPELEQGIKTLRVITDKKQGSDASFNLAKEILRKVYEIPEDEHGDGKDKSQDKDEKGKGQGEDGDEGDNDKDSSSNGKGENPGDGEAGDQVTTSKGLVIKFRDLVPMNHEPNLKSEGVTIDYSTYNRYGRGYAPSRELVIKKFNGR